MNEGVPIPAKTMEVSYGEFVCPHCKRTTTYKHKERVQRRLINLISFLGETLNEYVECQTCRKRFSMEVLRSGLPQDARQILDALQTKLLAGASIEETEAALIASGIDLRTAKRYVGVAAGIGHKHCPPCGLTFREEVIKCRKCGHVLPGKANH
jgi:transposase-like protein